MLQGVVVTACIWLKLILFLEQQNQSWFQVDHTNLHINPGCFLQVLLIHSSNLAASDGYNLLFRTWHVKPD